MLILNNVEIYFQNLGTIVAVFLKGKDKQAIEERFNSFWNHEATGGEPEWWTDEILAFWVWTSKDMGARDKILRAMTLGAWAELMNAGSKGIDAFAKAHEIAQKRYDQVEWVNWFKTETVVYEPMELGTSVSAEKGTGNFDDDVVAGTIEKGLYGGKDALGTPALEEPSIEEPVTDFGISDTADEFDTPEQANVQEEAELEDALANIEPEPEEGEEEEEPPKKRGRPRKQVDVALKV